MSFNEGFNDGLRDGPDDGELAEGPGDEDARGVQDVHGAEDVQGAEDMVAAYLAELSREAERLDENTRQELLDDVRSHIEVALAESENPDRAEVTRILTALGEPREIVDAASPEPPATPVVVMPPVFASAPEPWDPGAPYPLGSREIVAIVMLLIGALLAGVGWLVGLWLLWTSPRWNTREKLIGSLVLPGGLAPLALVMGTASGESCTSEGDGSPVCVHHGYVLPPWGAAVAVTLLVVLPVATSFFLWHRARAVRPAVLGGGGALAGVLVGVATAFGVMVAGCGLFMVASTSTVDHPATPAPMVSQEAPIPISASS